MHTSTRATIHTYSKVHTSTRERTYTYLGTHLCITAPIFVSVTQEKHLLC